MEQILSTLTHLITNYISATGLFGVGFLMTLESAGIPIPSEVIMPFSGFLVFQGTLTIWGVAFVGALGNLIGSLIAYYIGLFGGRPLVEKYGKYILLSKHDLDVTDKFFQKRGNLTVFIGRILPIVRTYISFPAGIARMKLTPFIIYTFVGAYIWSYALALAGVRLGENWEAIKIVGRKFDILIAILIIAGIVWYIRRHIRNNSKLKTQN
ncbi:alkaline phosphatase [Candidatus Berkelbacteria bacterium CG06_land_8_20_14_3_00_43_10]|nr:MAG: alkaline phosphatase [Candidatus Berkelbacteria bacterium CG2_30_43_20]PIU86961.1 MAG: alkaline phosphatase [Candidatus Berkelbacteria bacterium CG06_land_8_20_14_3_00_43_10]